MFTQVNIQRNEFIAEYCGEVVRRKKKQKFEIINVFFFKFIFS